MENKEVNLSEKKIAELGLILSDEKINATISPESRVFKYPALDNVFVMESDLYGNPMPEHSCFLAFEGRNGLIGKHITIDKLTRSSIDDIREIVAVNIEG
jgi:hypothetical protein